MDAYEIAELTAIAMGNFLTTFSVFISIASAYLVAAYLVGKNLTGLQLTIVNGCYLIATTILGYLVGANFRIFHLWASRNREMESQSLNELPALVDFYWPLTCLIVIIVLGSLTFMVTVRKSNLNDSLD